MRAWGAPYSILVDLAAWVSDTHKPMRIVARQSRPCRASKRPRGEVQYRQEPKQNNKHMQRGFLHCKDIVEPMHRSMKRPLEFVLPAHQT
ncbi:hypothetical protein D8I24_4284 [Cupriavidus necator H850]|jgi:hypothetical protein|nr:hypothetical protein D8I24_4284 [Cupriavidus necator H850]